jgi:aspartyl-tRNA(Asn)/glutamyl-tRNA(Gln) amidotransferase subunit C
MDKKTLVDMAYLARLTVEEADADNYCTQLNQILHFVEQMQQVNTTNIEPLAHPLPDIYTNATPWRIDAVTDSNQRESLQHCAPVAQDGFYVVPPVIE